MKSCRKRTVKRLIRRFKISVTPYPRVKLRIKVYRNHVGISFGDVSHDYLKKNNLMWDENGKYKFKGPHSYFSGGYDTVKAMWNYIRENHYDGNIHPMDYAD